MSQPQLFRPLGSPADLAAAIRAGYAQLTGTSAIPGRPDLVDVHYRTPHVARGRILAHRRQLPTLDTAALAVQESTP